MISASHLRLSLSAFRNFGTCFLIDHLHAKVHFATVVKAQKFNLHFLAFFQMLVRVGQALVGDL